MTLMSAIADRLLVASTNSNVKLRAEPGSGSVSSSLVSDLRRHRSLPVQPCIVHPPSSIFPRSHIFWPRYERICLCVYASMRLCDCGLCVRAEMLRSDVVIGPPYMRSPAKSRRAHSQPPCSQPSSVAPAAAADAATFVDNIGKQRIKRATQLQAIVLCATFLDYVSVALVLPNMPFRWKEFGVSPQKLGIVSSIYSISQLFGGLLLARLGDRKLGRKRTLLLSFAGAGISYGMVGFASTVETLVLSRIIVGLVKQTSTCSTALITKWSSDCSRAQALGRLSSASTLAFLAGNALGGAISSRYGRRVPCLVAVCLFAISFVLVLFGLPGDAPAQDSASSGEGQPAAAVTAAILTPAAATDKPGCKSRAAAKVNGVAAATAALTWRERLSLKSAALASTFTSAFSSESARRVLIFRLCCA